MVQAGTIYPGVMMLLLFSFCNACSLAVQCRSLSPGRGRPAIPVGESVCVKAKLLCGGGVAGVQAVRSHAFSHVTHYVCVGCGVRKQKETMKRWRLTLTLRQKEIGS